MANFWDQDDDAPAQSPSGKGSVSQTGTSQPMLEAKTARDAARNKLDLVNRVQPQLDRVRQLYERDLKGAGPLQSLREYLPSQRNSEFDAAAAQLKTLVRAATRTPGEGSTSNYESKLAVANVPDRWGFDGKNEEAIRGLQSFIDNTRTTYAKRMGLPTPPPRNRHPQERTITLDAQGNVIR